MTENDGSASEAEDCPPPSTPEGWQARTLQIVNRKGLHARATAKLVQCVEAYDAQVTVTRCGETVGGTSIMGILTLGAGIGTSITVAATGPAAVDVLDAVEKLIAGKFGEDE